MITVNVDLVWGSGRYGGNVYGPTAGVQVSTTCTNCEHLTVRHAGFGIDLAGVLVMCPICGTASGPHRPGMHYGIVEPRISMMRDR